MSEENANQVESARIAEEANAWAVRIDDASDDLALRREFEAWLGESKVHREEFKKAEGILAEMSLLNLPRQTSRVYRFPRFAVAAAIFVLLGLSLFFVNWPKDELIQTTRGERQELRLPDETLLTLDADSAVRVDFDEKKRRVQLVRGSVVFDIAKEERPFEVYVGDYRIEDIGTIFSVSLRADLHQGNEAEAPFTVAVKEGEVRVHRKGQTEQQSAPLLAGQRSEYIPSKVALPVVEEIKDGSFASWRSGVLQYRDRPLSEVLADLQRHFDGEILLKHPELGQERLTGSLRTDSIKESFAVLEGVLPLRVVWKTEDKVEVRSLK